MSADEAPGLQVLLERNSSTALQFAEPGFILIPTKFGQITNTLNDGRTFRV